MHTQSWTVEQIEALYELPLMDLLWRAQQIHRAHHKSNDIQLSSLLSIKTGGCPEDCSYCPQSSKYTTAVESEQLLDKNTVIAAALEAKSHGSQRFCMGAAWRSPTEKQIDLVIDLVKAVKAEGMETCVTLGMLKDGQAQRLKEAGLKSCVGGIIGLGESRQQRAQLIAQLANRKPYPESVPINKLVKVAGTPMADNEDIDDFEFIRTIAIARITMPTTAVRLSAGRSSLSDSSQTLCFVAGANSIFYGDQLLTTDNPQFTADQQLFDRLGITCGR